MPLRVLPRPWPRNIAPNTRGLADGTRSHTLGVRSLAADCQCPSPRFAICVGIHEVHGDGQPLVLLNGALDTIESDWAQHLPVFAARHRVLVYDHRGHGRTDNPSGSFTGYDQPPKTWQLYST